MLGLPLAFTIPFALVALAGLPVLYVLLKVTPPRPQRVPFPPLKLILDLKPKDETPAATPWWLLLLRLLLATLFILAMAGPIWNPISVGSKGQGTLLVALDTSWAAAPTWDKRVVAATQRIEAARQASRTVAVAATSDGAKDIVATDATTALERLHALAPVPYAPDRAALAGAITRFAGTHADTTIVWVSDGLERGGGRAFAQVLAGAAGEDHSHLRREVGAGRSPTRATTATSSPSGFSAPPRGCRRARHRARARHEGADDRRGALRLRARRRQGRRHRRRLRHADRAAQPDRPARGGGSALGRRRDPARLALAATQRRHRPPATRRTPRSRCSPRPTTCARRSAPSPTCTSPSPVRPDPIGAMLDDRVSVLVLADFGTISGPIRDRLSDWVDGGGLLVRFAGTRLSGATDELVPVKLRRGGRVLGGTLSWERPKHLAPFDPTSPFVGLMVPDEVTITRQVLAEPEPGLTGKTWAQLSDGTPLVTAAARGKGRVVLFHVTADTTWVEPADLRIVRGHAEEDRRAIGARAQPRRFAETEAKAAETVRTPSRRVSASSRTAGRIRRAGGATTDRQAGARRATPASPRRSTIRPASTAPQTALLAINALAPTETIPAFGRLAGLDLRHPHRWKPQRRSICGPGSIATAHSCCWSVWIASSALWLGGKLRLTHAAPSRWSAAAAAGSYSAPSCLAQAAAAGAGGCCHAVRRPTHPSRSRRSELSSALSVRLAYVDQRRRPRSTKTSRQGLASLSNDACRAHLADAGRPDRHRSGQGRTRLLSLALLADRRPTNPQPSQKAIEKIAAYMRQGGTIVFDTRDALGAAERRADAGNGVAAPAAGRRRRARAGADRRPITS